MRLLDCFIPFFALTRQFQTVPEADAATLSERLGGLVVSARDQAREAGFSDADTEDALFAAAAWADEAILSISGWAGAADWPRYLLQRRYFSVTNAGVAFFERLNKLAPGETAVREVYGLALGLGFAGRYSYGRDEKSLDGIRRATLDALLDGDGALPGDTSLPMFPDGYGALLAQSGTRAVRRVMARRSVSRLTWIGLLGPLIALLVLAVIYRALLWRMAAPILARIPL